MISVAYETDWEPGQMDTVYASSRCELQVADCLFYKACDRCMEDHWFDYSRLRISCSGIFLGVRQIR